MNELSPTTMRNSIIGGMSLVLFACMISSVLITTMLMLFFHLGIVCLAIGVPSIVVSLTIFLIKGRETKGVDLGEVKL